jgi:hypothetical protein
MTVLDPVMMLSQQPLFGLELPVNMVLSVLMCLETALILNWSRLSFQLITEQLRLEASEIQFRGFKTDEYILVKSKKHYILRN